MKSDISVPRLKSNIGFHHMEEFIDNVRDGKIADQLIDSLRECRPFRRFKDVLDEYPDLVNQWYAFKNKKLNKEVRNFIAALRHDRIELLVST